MHPNNSFRKASLEQNLAFARERSFGILAINNDGGPLLSHIPFFLDVTGQYLEAHLVRSNPIIRLLGARQTGVVAVNGPDCYISPDWYAMEDQVPTWNYVAVHIRGTIEKLGEEKLPQFLQRLTHQFEEQFLSKPIWTMDKMNDNILEKMLKLIVPIQMNISAIEGTWKLNQNKPDQLRTNAANQVSSSGIGIQLDQLAKLMKDPPC